MLEWIDHGCSGVASLGKTFFADLVMWQTKKRFERREGPNLFEGGDQLFNVVRGSVWNRWDSVFWLQATWSAHCPLRRKASSSSENAGEG